MAQGIKKVSENVIIDGRALTLTNGTITDNGVIPTGTLRCNLVTKGLEYKSAPNVFSKFDAAGMLLEGSITTDQLANGAVTTIKLGDLAVTTVKLGDLSVTTGKLADYSVTEIKLASNSVSESKLQVNAVTESKIKDRSIGNMKIKVGGILSENLGDNQVINRTIANAAVNDRTLATDAVHTKHIKDLQITNNKFAIGSIYGQAIKDLGIETRHLAMQAVTDSKLADGAVTTPKIGDKQVTQRCIGDLAVGTINLDNESVTKIKLAKNAVGNINIEDNAISIDKLTTTLREDITNAVKYEGDTVNLRGDLNVNGHIRAKGDIEGARVLNAVYMDLAEAYVPGEELEVGNIVEIREDGKVYKSTFLSNTVVGVVSDQYAACFGATTEELRDGKKIAVGLIGKVPVKILGSVTIGDKIGIDENGLGMRCSNCTTTNIIGKALETNTDISEKEVLCLIYPN